MTKRYVINGKFMRAPPTGVHRVAKELINALESLKQEGHPAVSGQEYQVDYPYDGASEARHIAMKKHILSPLTGIPWEQVTLPIKRGPATLLNFCNIGPGLSRNAVTMIHDVQVHISPDSYSKPFRLWYHFIQPLFARRHKMILTVSAFSKAEIVRVGLSPAEKIVVIYNGVDHILRDAAQPGIVGKLGLAGEPYVLALSTTQAHKNIQILLSAFSRPEMAHIKLVLVGGTSQAAFEAEKLTVPDNAIFTGRVSDGELRSLMEAALCFAFPSTTEGFGLPPLEAMLLGCPAIVAPCGALPEVCGSAVIYAAPDDAQAWQNAVLRMNLDPEWRAQQSKLGIAQAAKYSWKNSAITLATALKQLDKLNP